MIMSREAHPEILDLAGKVDVLSLNEAGRVLLNLIVELSIEVFEIC